MMQIDSSSGGAQGDGDSRRQQIGSRTKGAGQLVSRKLDFSSQIAGFLGWSRNFESCSMLSKKNALVSFMGFEFPYCCKVLLMLKFFFNHTLKLHNPPENIIHK